jgi:hypothetical protein
MSKQATKFSPDNARAEYDGNPIRFQAYTAEEKANNVCCKKCILHETDITKLAAGCGDHNRCLREYHNGVSGYYIPASTTEVRT